MELISLKFVLFLAVLLVVYYVVGRFAPKGQWFVLLVGSLAFYALVCGWLGLGLLVGSAFVTWLGALVLYGYERRCKKACEATDHQEEQVKITKSHRRKRRLVLVGTILLFIAELVFFKTRDGVAPYPGSTSPVRSLVVPLGLSFYLLQELGYLIDAYRSNILPQGNFARYLLFVSYFPQIAYGPINRYGELNDHLVKAHRPYGPRIERGLLRMGFGALKILAITNVLSNAVDAVFQTAAGPQIAGSLAWYGVIVYAVYAYAEFSGVIDITEGVSELLGIKMSSSYRQPFFATSMTDFWGRWFVSLLTWMHDYVYDPLLACKLFRNLNSWLHERINPRTAAALVACLPTLFVFVLVGLWHGVAPRYAAWGLFNGAIIALSALCMPLLGKLSNALRIPHESKRLYAFRLARTFALVCVGRFFECFGSVTNALYALGNAFADPFAMPLSKALGEAGAVYADGLGFTTPTVLACVFVLLVDIARENNLDVRTAILHWRLPARVALYAFVCVLMGCAAALDTTNGGGDLLYALS